MSEGAAVPRSAYIHVPFCTHRCGYCSFTLIANRADLVDRYLLALERELSWLGSPQPVETLFIGGGTPTFLSAPALTRLLQLVRARFPLLAGYEFSVEANPDGLDAERMAVLADHGVTRISLGAQSFDPAKLRALERAHSPADVRKSVDLARRKMRSVSLDLIFGAPGETIESWRSDLDAAISVSPDHVSTYGLTYEQGTTFWSRRRKRELVPADEELERSLYADAIDRLTAGGFEHYEVSNFARAGHRCRHNEVYWAGQPYFAAGPGAARYVGGWREINHRSTTTWMARVLADKSPVAEAERLSPEDRAREALVLGLRKLEGVSLADFGRATGFEVDELVGKPLAQYLDQGLLSRRSGRLQLTREGLFVSDAIWPHFLRC
jgi:oxygen-independent coproporphyrinogen-3 oxidase